VAVTSLHLPLWHVVGLGCLVAVGCSDEGSSAEPGGVSDAGPTSAAPTGGSSTTASASTASVGTTGSASATGSSVPSTTGSGGTAGATIGGASTAGGVGSVTTGATDGSVPAQPVDCAAIAAHVDWELCDSGADFCAAVFKDGAGCSAVCAAVGLACAEAWEDAEDSCAPDMSRAALGCASDSGHESDYCVCQGPGAATSQGSTAAASSSSSDGSGGTTGSSSTSSDGSGAASSTSSDTTASASTATASATTSGGTGGGTNPGCEDVNGDAGTVDSTIVVESGQTFDGECRRYRAGSALGDGSQDENQDPVFRVEDGGRLINVVLGSPAADGIHTYGDVTLENIVWEDIGEDAMTIKESGTVVLDGGGAFNGEDKVFQINAASTFRVSNFTARSAGKFIRQNGDTTFRVDVFIDRCDISQMDEAIFRTDSSSSTVSMTNTRYSDIGDALFIGVSEGNITTSGNTEY